MVPVFLDNFHATIQPVIGKLTAIVCLALQQLRADPEAANLKLDQVVFLAPNVDREEFDRNFKSELDALVNRLTIYVASDDNVLLLGKLLYNVNSIGLPEQFSPDTNLDEIQTFLYYEKQLPGKIDLVDVSFSKKRLSQEASSLSRKTGHGRPVLVDPRRLPGSKTTSAQIQRNEKAN